MQIAWDDRKRLSNLDKHGLDFADLTEDWFLDAAILAARGKRLMAIGELAGGTVVVVFAALGSEAISIISMRPAGAAERNLLR